MSRPAQGLTDAWCVANPDAATTTAFSEDHDPGATYYTDVSGKIGERIDYCFTSADLAEQIVSAKVLADVDASDHQPLLVSLDAEPTKKAVLR
ncbi:hypothetical protein [Bradyrhizobium sp. SSUT77]|uniref:hypothetical protein n=1 Tax=Bradyrhizobium sp. SSUT77 TaxID=3040603 RepID=UPI002448B841|nr:hypothetical protein [Bradyrhizobium sp. SSUT77]MDH2347762.1 hypothetical protein [Bradyrhizobium sp. SSUT77]